MDKLGMSMILCFWTAVGRSFREHLTYSSFRIPVFDVWIPCPIAVQIFRWKVPGIRHAISWSRDRCLTSVNAYKFYFTKTMFYVSEMNWLESRYNKVIKSSNMISDQNGRWFCIKEAFKAKCYLFAKSQTRRSKC